MQVVFTKRVLVLYHNSEMNGLPIMIMNVLNSDGLQGHRLATVLNIMLLANAGVQMYCLATMGIHFEGMGFSRLFHVFAFELVDTVGTMHLDSSTMVCVVRSIPPTHISILSL